MDHWIGIGYFAIALSCVGGIVWLSGVKDKLTGPVLLTAVFVVVSIMALATWKQPVPEGVLPVLAGVIGYAFGIVTKKEP
ncbi:MAG TPA: hypothetical protein VHF01_17475 [Candidatus Acidoferrum sp.]|nr:hypothetical protein [Candidatus Acidoferrum sp.]